MNSAINNRDLDQVSGGADCTAVIVLAEVHNLVGKILQASGDPLGAMLFYGCPRPK
jgi:hypothetical protein